MPTFPILNLPPQAIIHVMKSMDYKEIFNISFCSERAREAVKTLNLKSDPSSSVCISDTVSIYMSVGEEKMQWHFEDEEHDEDLYVSPLPQQYVSLQLYRRNAWRVVWIKENFGLKDWIGHFMPIFHLKEFYTLQFVDHCQMLDIDEIKTTITNFNKLLICENGTSNDYYEEILQRFISSKSLDLDPGVYERLKNPKYFLIQNYDLLQISLEDVSPCVMKLDDLLLVNSKNISIDMPRKTEKTINRFIKHWIKGSNPQMEMLRINYPDNVEFDKAITLRGIKSMEAPENAVRKFKTLIGKDLVIDGGIDIFRLDGTKATIVFQYTDVFEIYSLLIYVWYPHCIGD